MYIFNIWCDRKRLRDLLSLAFHHRCKYNSNDRCSLSINAKEVGVNRNNQYTRNKINLHFSIRKIRQKASKYLEMKTFYCKFSKPCWRPSKRWMMNFIHGMANIKLVDILKRVYQNFLKTYSLSFWKYLDIIWVFYFIHQIQNNACVYF